MPWPLQTVQQGGHDDEVQHATHQARAGASLEGMQESYSLASQCCCCPGAGCWPWMCTCRDASDT